MGTASIQLDEATFDLPAPPEMVWQRMIDPAVVVRCVPGASIVDVRDDGTIEGGLSVKLGPTVVEFRGNVVPAFDHGGREGSLVARGADQRGRTRAEATTIFRVDARDEAGSTIVLRGEINVNGPLAAFVQSGGVHLARRMMQDFAENLAVHCERDAHAAPGSAGEATGPAAPLDGRKLVLGAVGAWWRGVVARVRATLKRRRGAEEAPLP